MSYNYLGTSEGIEKSSADTVARKTREASVSEPTEATEKPKTGSRPNRLSLPTLDIGKSVEITDSHAVDVHRPRKRPTLRAIANAVRFQYTLGNTVQRSHGVNAGLILGKHDQGSDSEGESSDSENEMLGVRRKIDVVKPRPRPRRKLSHSSQDRSKTGLHSSKSMEKYNTRTRSDLITLPEFRNTEKPETWDMFMRYRRKQATKDLRLKQLQEKAATSRPAYVPLFSRFSPGKEIKSKTDGLPKLSDNVKSLNFTRSKVSLPVHHMMITTRISLQNRSLSVAVPRPSLASRKY